MTISFGTTVFDKVSYDRDADVLYLNVEGTETARWDESPEGHVLRFDENGDLCGVTLIGVQHNLDANGGITVTVPSREVLDSDELDQALALA
jgi:uncharacterized protein YuzE